MTDAARPGESRSDHARRLYRAGNVNVAELSRLTGAPVTLLVTLTGQWRAEMEREGRVPKRGVR